MAPYRKKSNTPYEKWQEEKASRKPVLAERLIPQSQSDRKWKPSETNSKGYTWEKDLLGDIKGKSYNDKFNKAMDSLGITSTQERMGFRNYLDDLENSEERRSKEVNPFDSWWPQHKKEPKDISNVVSQVNNVKPKQNTFLQDITTPLKNWGTFAKQAINPFDDVSPYEAWQQANQQNLQDAAETERSGITNEWGRAASRTLNTATLGALENVEKRATGETNKAFQSRQGGGAVADVVYDSLGYLIPGTGAYKAVSGLGKGATGVKRLGVEAAKGAGIGGVLAGAEVGIREGLNPNDYNAQQNLTHLGIGVGAGAIADPLVMSIGALLKRGKSVKEIAEEVGVDEKVVEQLALPAPKEVLELPAPKLELPPPVQKTPDIMEVFKKPTFNNPIPQIPDVIKNDVLRGQAERKGLYFAQQGKNVPTARMPQAVESTGSRYWQKQIEDFNRFIDNRGYDRNQLTQEGLEDLWSQFAKYEDSTTLEKAIDLAYTGAEGRPRVKAYEEPIGPKEPTLKDELKKDERINKLAKEFFPPERKISRPATLQEMFDRLESLAPPKKVEPKQFPLEFRKTIYKNTNKLTSNVEGKKFENISPESFKDDGVPLKRLPKEQVENISPEKTPKTSDKEMQEIRDISQFQVGTQNIYQLAERLPNEQRTRIVSTLDAAKKANVDHQEKLTNDLYNKVVKELKITKGSKDSALVQDFGEKTLAKRYLKKKGIDSSKLSEKELDEINLQQLQKVAPNKWENIVKADKYFRGQYKQLIEQVNEVRKQLYPNNPEKIVPERKDYYHHFNQLEGFEGFKNLFETPANIDPHLEGISPFTKPKAAFQGFMQKRGNGKYTSDAVGGFLKYLQASSHSINIDPVISVIRKTADEIADATTETKNANKIKQALEMHAKDLAGKSNPYDTILQLIIGRKGVKIAGAANSRVKGNMIVGNLASALGQLGSVPLGVGKAKQYAIPALADSLSNTANQVLSKVKVTTKNMNAPIYQSQFIKERYSDRFYRRFDQKLLDQPKKLALWILETVEKSGTDYIWHSMYRQGLGKKVKDPIKYADDQTRHIVAGRGVGEVPLIQKAKTTQILAPFTLEVGNQWNVLKGMVGEKDATGLMTFLIASYGLNKAIEQVRGSGVSFDPVGAVQEGYQKGEGGVGAKSANAAASLLGEVVGNIPGGNLLTSQVNTNKKVPFTDIQYKELFGERDPNRFGTGLTLAKAIQDPLYGILPFGASQVRKTTQGIDAIRNEAVYKKDNGTIPFMGPKKELQYPVNTSPLNNLKMATMGPSSTSDAKEYYDNERRPLTEHQTNAYKRLKSVGLDDELYAILRKSDTSSYNKGKITKIEKDSDLSDAQKIAKLRELISKLQK